MTPLVTIIIPCYNAERYIADAIESALAQTYRPIEVIVIDDGSTDRSAAIARRFGEKVRFESIPNQGAAAARNRAIELATGELIQFLDADDLLHPQKLEKMVPMALEDVKKLPFCMAAANDLVTGAKMKSWGAPIKPETDSVAHVFDTLLAICMPLHRTAALKEVGGFRLELKTCEDPDLHFRLAASGLAFTQIAEELLTIRRVKDSLSRRDPTLNLQMQQKFACDAATSLQRQNQLTDQRAQAIAGFLASAARRAIRAGFDDLATELFETAKKIHTSGGLSMAYSSPVRRLVKIVGPVVAEKLVGMKRALSGNRELE